MSYQVLSQQKKTFYDKTMRYDVTQLNDFIVSEELKSLSEIFSEKLFNNFNTHDQIEHFINLLFKKLFRKDSIYNMSHDEFVAIKNYLNNAFKKKIEFDLRIIK